jgi:hypothetical protein
MRLVRPGLFLLGAALLAVLLVENDPAAIATFVIPASLGALEGCDAAIVTALGIGAPPACPSRSSAA